MRTVKQIHNARYAPIADLVTYSPLPSRTLEQIDPFLFLNHHGPQVYQPHNSGLPFGPHPHRGMETVTFILEGDILHKDSGGHESVITAGGVQWMTAGRGLIHAEVSSEEFKTNGGPLEILQLWINLPSRLKMTPPRYEGRQRKDIPVLQLQDGKVEVQLIAGRWDDKTGPFDSLTGVQLSTVFFQAGAALQVQVPVAHQVLFYVVRGRLTVNGHEANERQLVEFENDAEWIRIEAAADSVLLLGHAEPLREPVVAQGPFVMNTQQEILEAYNDYRNGKFGSWH